ncbi:MAG TPA: deoxyribose-phosphate aldolase [Solirubrobacterales bacterium]|nr:deoxyribose-phosphate aldolase [Solirubrobacterales bacterium]
MTALPRPLPSYIDHTLLRPEATQAAVRQVVEEGALHGFAAVVVPPVHVPLAASILAGTGVHVGTVAAFPLGYSRPEVRREESLQAVGDGALEVDTVINLSWLKGGEDGRVADDLGAWVEALRAERDGLVLKVILETALLEDAEKLRGAGLVAAAGADFVKTSTGFGPEGATVADVALLAGALAAGTGQVGVKAAGGIRDAETALAMIAAGATRLGTSSGVAILRSLS